MRARRRGTTALVVAVVVVGALGGGWWAATTLQSPAQVAANAAPPPPGDVLAAVTLGELSEQITARSDVVRASATTVGITLGADPQSVVTEVSVPAGSQLTAGASALEVNGRPVIATTGAFPYYRDMVEGDTGPDVEQLQRFLVSRGFSTGGIGPFGPQTARAVRELYRAAGYEPLEREAEASADAPPATTGTDTEADTAPAAPAAPKTLVVVPRSELVVVGSLPGVVSATPGLGTVLTADNATLTVGEGAIVAKAKVAVSVLPVLTEGMAVTLVGGDGTLVDGTLGPIPAPPTGADQAPEVEITLSTGPIDGAWLGTNVLTTITVTSVAEEALRVPARAVTLHADGTATVLRQEDGGTFVDVEVRETGRLGGTSAVEPVTAGTLSAGDQVKVG
ncbi:peptidoglycan-binding domain-containing protein [Cellulomonas oligotrophica]|uniref:Peptidoglycan hydrolase-like protein with peptidoglycan-binding domain n=1 Tax=Cellulomonas oligotrophica TaxID=931536 RepID=A0A7Y9FGQ6_9CELL|nr:peptidoglycan-binding domain-containing protein [Cellulomonas oligotrophica]NYD86587.1 peptidoglycan hydrolase-like protein with peptidoglycan-binding domain [Cellulomonas oligotrophica]